MEYIITIVSTQQSRVLIPKGGDTVDLSDRKERILATVVETYIASGEPVGSKFLCASAGFAVSSATLRNEMAVLTELGFLEQPHTSAGRIPSQKGFRYYLDHLMGQYEPSPVDIFGIRNRMDFNEGDTQKLLATAAGTLAELTGCAAIITTPFASGSRIRRTDLVPLGGKNVMMVLSVSNGMLKSRICRCETDVSYEMLELFYKLAGSGFIQRSPDEITTALMQTVAASLGDRAFEMAPMLAAFADAAKEAAETEVLAAGLSNLLRFREFDGKAGALQELLRNSKRAVRLLRTQADGKVRVLLGTENRYPELSNAAVVCSGYSVDGRESGMLGIVGPMRMDYAGIIPLVRYTASLVGAMLDENMHN